MILYYAGAHSLFTFYNMQYSVNNIFTTNRNKLWISVFNLHGILMKTNSSIF